MDDYLQEVAFAVERLLEAIWHERDELQGLGDRIKELTEKTTTGYLEASRLAGNEDDDELLATTAYWQTYSGVDQARLHHENVRAVLAAQVTTHGFSVGALSAALLQIGQQGISLVQSGRGSVSGRQVGTQSLKTVIWEGRNQAMHWDDDRGLKPPAKGCFDGLGADFGDRFKDYERRSLAFEVIEVLGWRTLGDFDSDLQLLR